MANKEKMGNKGHDPNLDRVKELLTLVRNSCEEGLSGSWDCSTEEGREGFIAMVDDIEEAARELGIELEPYEPDNNEDDDEEN